MKKNLHVILVLLFFLTACSAVTTTPLAPTETPYLLESISTETLTPIPSETPTTTPLPPIESFSATQKSVSQFASAMQKAGINITAELILKQGLQIQTVIGADGKEYEIAFAHLDPDPSTQGEILEGDYPLMIKVNNGWKELGREIVQISGLDSFGSLIEYREIRSEYDNLDKTYGKYFTLGAVTYIWDDQHPKTNEYDNAWTDWEISRAKKVGINKFRLQVLIWGEGSSSYSGFSKDELTAEMEKTIEIQMKHFTQLGVNEFVVVNESAYAGSGRKNDIFYRIIGNDYVKIAFQKARSTNNKAILIYNDFENQYNYNPAATHTKDIIELLKADNLIDGVGVQMHLKARDGIDYENITETLIGYGLPVYITEMSIDMTGIPDIQEQALIWERTIEAILKSKQCKSITVWGIGDKYSWEFTSGKTNANSTLFDDMLEPKAQFYTVQKALLEKLPLKAK
jgi:endo-1,4-beta-xylanase